MKVICIAHPRHRPEQRSLSEQLRSDIRRFRNSSKVRAIYAHGEQDRGGEEESRYYGSWIGIMRPVGGIETGAPLNIPMFLGGVVIGLR